MVPHGRAPSESYLRAYWQTWNQSRARPSAQEEYLCLYQCVRCKKYARWEEKGAFFWPLKGTKHSWSSKTTHTHTHRPQFFDSFPWSQREIINVKNKSLGCKLVENGSVLNLTMLEIPCSNFSSFFYLTLFSVDFVASSRWWEAGLFWEGHTWKDHFSWITRQYSKQQAGISVRMP